MPNELLPTNIQFGTVVGRFGSAPLIAGDADGLPDFSPATGLTVTFTPSTAAVIDATASPAPVTIEMVPIVCGLDTQGYLVGGDGQRGVKLIATNDTDINPSGWTYSVTFLRGGAKVAAFRDFSMALPAGVTKDIALTIPVPSSEGVSLSQAQAAEAAAVSAASTATAAASSAAASLASIAGAVTVDNLGQATTLGKAVAKAADAATVRASISAVGRGDLVLNVRDYALGSDTHDGQALTRALAVASTAGGGVVFMPPGTYAITPATSSGYTIPANTTLRGAGNRTILNVTTATPGAYLEVFYNGGDNVAVEALVINRAADSPMVVFPVRSYNGYTVRGVTVNGRRDIYPNYCHGLFLGTQPALMTGLSVLDCTFSTMRYPLLMDTVSTNTTTGVRVERCTFANNYADDLEFNSPNGLISGVRVRDCIFRDNQVNLSGLGFGIGMAHVTDAVIEGNTFSNYQNVAIQLEDACADVKITKNHFQSCGLSFFAVIIVLTNSNRIRIESNTFDQTAAIASGIYAVSVQIGANPGGGTLTPGGRTALAPRQVSVVNNVMNLGAACNGVYFEAVINGGFISGNQFLGTGGVSGSSFSGGFNIGLNIASGRGLTITDNYFRAIGYGTKAMQASAVPFGPAALVRGNTFDECFLGLGCINIAAGTFSNNIMRNCVHPMIVGYASGINQGASIIGNQAVGCTNPLSIYGSVRVVAGGAITVGTGKTLPLTGGSRNTMPAGVNVYFSGGGVFTTSAITNFADPNLFGTLTGANVASAETGLAFMPYSSDTSISRVVSGNVDDFFGSTGHDGVKTTAVNYQMSGHESAVITTTTGITVTLPSAVAARGFSHAVKNTAAGSVTVAAAAGNVDGASTATLTTTTTARYVSDGTNWIKV